MGTLYVGYGSRAIDTDLCWLITVQSAGSNHVPVMYEFTVDVPYALAPGGSAQDARDVADAVGSEIGWLKATPDGRWFNPHYITTVQLVDDEVHAEAPQSWAMFSRPFLYLPNRK